ncbi:MAG: TlpA family protein disulfide reductase [Leptospiraceae bacterium]|nr:TlpA family protein disulfide reductase [Leptospiraceae bacterium]MCK6380523.1 TlpA family protein disulfide reductase [Leptospiraceae bacterium]NUM41055.1 TlpA family protein disulfide reductase [Leptospiraceae bacterium]
MNKIIFILFFIISCTQEKQNTYLSISLKDWNGKEFTLSDYRGKIIVLDFWASWCEPCKKSIPVIESLKKGADPEKIIFRGINTDSGKSPKEVKKIAENFGMTYDSLLDPDTILSDTLQITGLPALAFFNEKGELLYRQYGVSAIDFPYLSHKLKNWAIDKN